MGGADEHPPAVRRVAARRISTGDGVASPVDETVGVVVETPVTVDVQGVGSFTLLCTPADERALATGFLLSEGIIDGMDDVEFVRPCEDDAAVVRVGLTRRSPLVDDQDRSMLIVSSCGACGSESLDRKLTALPRVGDTLAVEGSVLRSVHGTLRGGQVLFEACGGTHAAGVFTYTGEIVSSAEDAGRHNALDKAIGACLLAGGSTAGRGAVLSGRVSLEMVSKCARAGIELISAISAPTSLAIDVAERCNITLCTFVRETRATVFTHPRRITDA